MAEADKPFKSFDLDNAQEWRLTAGTRYAMMYGEATSDRKLVSRLKEIQSEVIKELERQAQKGSTVSADLFRTSRTIENMIGGVLSEHARKSEQLGRLRWMFKGEAVQGYGTEPLSYFLPNDPNHVMRQIVIGETVEPTLPQLP